MSFGKFLLQTCIEAVAATAVVWVGVSVLPAMGAMGWFCFGAVAMMFAQIWVSVFLK